jgi:regulator of sigma E protease
MMGALEVAASFILVLGILVFVHEFGHFIVAKAFKIGVPVFSLGFGPRLFGFRRNGTDYRVSAVPLGGYVRLKGDEADESRTGAPDEFLTRPRLQRFLVFVAGGVFNIALALLASWIAFSVYGLDEPKFPDKHPVIGAVVPDSPAERAGLRTGDRLLLVAGQDARRPGVLFQEIVLSPETVKPIVIERGGQRISLELPTGSDPRYHLGEPGIVPVLEDSEPPVVDYVVPGDAADEAGIEEGDRVLRAEGRPLAGDVEIRQLLQKSPGKPVHLELQRGDRTVALEVVPKDQGGQGRIGVAFKPSGIVHRDLTVAEAAVQSVRLNLEVSRTLFTTLGKLFRGEISLRAFSGPIEIAQVSRQAVRGLQSFLSLLAFISLQLGILNLLPIPVLDGGHIVILAIEAVMRRDLSERVKERVMQAGFVFLIGFFCVILYFDVVKVAR